MTDTPKPSSPTPVLVLVALLVATNLLFVVLWNITSTQLTQLKAQTAEINRKCEAVDGQIKKISEPAPAFQWGQVPKQNGVPSSSLPDLARKIDKLHAKVTQMQDGTASWDSPLPNIFRGQKSSKDIPAPPSIVKISKQLDEVIAILKAK